MPIERKYSEEVKSASIARVMELRRERAQARGIIAEVATDFDVGVQSLRRWVARIDDGSYDFSLGEDEKPTRAAVSREPDHQASSPVSESGNEASEVVASATTVAAPGSGHSTQAELERLRQRVEELLRENETLRDALAIMSRPRPTS